MSFPVPLRMKAFLKPWLERFAWTYLINFQVFCSIFCPFLLAMVSEQVKEIWLSLRVLGLRSKTLKLPSCLNVMNILKRSCDQRCDVSLTCGILLEKHIHGGTSWKFPDIIRCVCASRSSSYGSKDFVGQIMSWQLRTWQTSQVKLLTAKIIGRIGVVRFRQPTLTHSHTTQHLAVHKDKHYNRRQMMKQQLQHETYPQHM